MNDFELVDRVGCKGLLALRNTHFILPGLQAAGRDRRLLGRTGKQGQTGQDMQTMM